MFEEYDHEEMLLMRNEIFNSRWRSWVACGNSYTFDEEDKIKIREFFLNMKSRDLINKYMTYEIALLVCIENFRRWKGPIKENANQE